MKIGKNKILSDVLQGHGGGNPTDGGHGYFKVSAGSFDERAGYPDLDNHYPNMRPADDGMVRYNNNIEHLEAYIRGAWTNLVSDADIRTTLPQDMTEEDNVTLQYLSLILRQINRNIMGSIHYQNGGHNANVTPGTPAWFTNLSGPAVEGTHTLFGEKYILMNMGGTDAIIDAFRAAFPTEDPKERWNYRYEGFCTFFETNTALPGGYGMNYGYAYMSPAWTKEPSTDPDHPNEDPNYGKFRLTTSFGAAAVYAMGVRWFVSLFKYQNYRLTNVVEAPPLPTIEPLTGTVNIPIIDDAYNFDIKSFIVSNYPNWDGLTPLTINIHIDTDVVIGSVTPNKPAFYTGDSWPVGTVLNLFNNGKIIGCAGNGGSGGLLTRVSATDGRRATPITISPPENGEGGGSALKADYHINITNTNGHIWAPGGGGGGAPVIEQDLVTFYSSTFGVDIPIKTFSSALTAANYYAYTGTGPGSNITDLEDGCAYIEFYKSTSNNKYNLILIVKNSTTSTINLSVTNCPAGSSLSVIDDAGDVTKTGTTVTANFSIPVGGGADGFVLSDWIISSTNLININYISGTGITKWKYINAAGTPVYTNFSTQPTLQFKYQHFYWGGSGGGGGAGSAPGQGGFGGVTGPDGCYLDNDGNIINGNRPGQSTPYATDGSAGIQGTLTIGGIGGQTSNSPITTAGAKGGDINTDGDSVNGGGTGGNKGKAIEGNNNITWIAIGDRVGTVT
jgi:hypothetical protein